MRPYMHWSEVASEIGVKTSSGVRHFAKKHKLVKIGAGKYTRRSFNRALERLHEGDSWQQSKQGVSSTKQPTRMNSETVLDDLLA